MKPYKISPSKAEELGVRGCRVDTIQQQDCGYLLLNILQAVQ